MPINNNTGAGAGNASPSALPRLRSGGDMLQNKRVKEAAAETAYPARERLAAAKQSPQYAVVLIELRKYRHRVLILKPRTRGYRATADRAFRHGGLTHGIIPDGGLSRTSDERG